MYTSFRIKNFRCFEDLELKDLARVNLIAGKNNVGKTAVLEALWWNCEPHMLLRRMEAFAKLRGMDLQLEQPASGLLPSVTVDPVWLSLFHRFDPSNEISLSTEMGGPSRSIVVRAGGTGNGGIRVFWVRDKPSIEIEVGRIADRGGGSSSTLDFDGTTRQSVFLDSRTRLSPQEEAIIAGSLVKTGRYGTMLSALQILEPRLRTVTTLPEGGQTILYGDIGTARLLPLRLMGDGMVRLTTMMLTVASIPAGVLLIDEVENGIHHSVLQRVWKAIADAARQFDVQVFATTHSYECIAAAHQAFSRHAEEGKEYDFRLHRLEEADGKIVAVTYGQNAIEAALNIGLEVRS